MRSAIDQPTTFLEQMSNAVASWSQADPTVMQVMSPYHLMFSVFVVKSRITRSGAGGVVLPASVVPFILVQVPVGDVVNPHQPRDALTVGPPSPHAQLDMDARAP
ncbi:hypothetical protein [Streptomyces syringium]|uniref:hypothetical protein n=1 Tax=Streptomyces syringium TaxID=76729 RepID=UPI003453B069